MGHCTQQSASDWSQTFACKSSLLVCKGSINADNFSEAPDTRFCFSSCIFAPGNYGNYGKTIKYMKKKRFVVFTDYYFF